MQSKKMTLLLTSLATGFEYYDFVIYGSLVSYLSQVFFPQGNNITHLIQTFAIFAMGYLARPLGGIIFGHLGDRKGRKFAFFISLTGVALMTFTLGFLPTYAQCGIIAPILLLVVRILQGITFGGSIPGTITLITEHAGANRSATFCSLSVACVSLGAMLGSFLIYFLVKSLTHVQMLSYGWRIPFLVGGGLIIFCYLVKKNAAESPLFVQSSKQAISQHPVIELIKNYPQQIFLGVGLTLFTACFVIFGISMPAYLHQFYQFNMEQIYLPTTIGLLWCTLLLPVFGWIADHMGRLRMLGGGALIMIITMPFFFSLLKNHGPYSLYFFMIIYETILAALASCYLPLLAELFPTRVRYSGVAFCYNLVYSFAGLTPLLVSKLASLNFYWVTTFFMTLAFLTVLSAVYIFKSDLKTKQTARLASFS